MSSAAERSSPLEGRRLYLCTADRPDLLDFVAQCVEGGVDVVQFRDKDLEARDIVERATALQSLCEDVGVPFILNDRPDLALEVGADGTHVGQQDVSASLARRILGPCAIVGLSTHCESELESASGEPVDYVSVGPVVPTPTKPGRPGTGTGLVSYAAERFSGPFFVTGGVNPDSVAQLAAAGARRFVVVRYLTQSDAPRAAASKLREAIDGAVEEGAGRAVGSE